MAVAAGDNYRVAGAAGSASLIVRDDDIPVMTITVDKTAIFEGKSFTRTISRSGFFETHLVYVARILTLERALPPLGDLRQEYTTGRVGGSVLRVGQREFVITDSYFQPLLVGPLGSVREIEILAFDEDRHPFRPQYTLGEPHEMRVEISNRRPTVAIEVVGDITSAEEGTAVAYQITRAMATATIPAGETEVAIALT